MTWRGELSVAVSPGVDPRIELRGEEIFYGEHPRGAWRFSDFWVCNLRVRIDVDLVWTPFLEKLSLNGGQFGVAAGIL